MMKCDDCKKTLSENKQIRHKMKTIQRKFRQLRNYKINKISLPCFEK